MKNTFLFLILLLFCTQSYAQDWVERQLKVGVEAGVNVDLRLGKSFDYQPKLGYVFGGYTEGKLGNRFAWRTGLGLSRQRVFVSQFQMIKTHQFDNGFTDTLSIRTGVLNKDYLLFYTPVIFKVKLGKKKRWSVGVGVEFTHGIKGEYFRRDTTITYYPFLRNPKPNDKLADPFIETGGYFGDLGWDGALLTTVSRVIRLNNQWSLTVKGRFRNLYFLWLLPRGTTLRSTNEIVFTFENSHTKKKRIKRSEGGYQRL